MFRDCQSHQSPQYQTNWGGRYKVLAVSNLLTTPQQSFQQCQKHFLSPSPKFIQSPCEGKVVKLVDKLKDPKNPSGTASVLDRHRQDCGMLEVAVAVNVLVEPGNVGQFGNRYVDRIITNIKFIISRAGESKERLLTLV